MNFNLNIANVSVIWTKAICAAHVHQWNSFYRFVGSFSALFLLHHLIGHIPVSNCFVRTQSWCASDWEPAISCFLSFPCARRNCYSISRFAFFLSSADFVTNLWCECLYVMQLQRQIKIIVAVHTGCGIPHRAIQQEICTRETTKDMTNLTALEHTHTHPTQRTSIYLYIVFFSFIFSLPLIPIYTHFYL